MDPMQAVQSAFGNYANFNGRARRSEYWWFFVVVNVVVGALVFAGGVALPALAGVGGLVGLASLLPALAVTVRRLHDTDRSGLWILLGLVPFGGLVLLVFFAQPGTSGPNSYGPDPL